MMFAHQNKTKIYQIIQIVLLCSKERTHLEIKAVQPKNLNIDEKVKNGECMPMSVECVGLFGEVS